MKLFKALIVSMSVLGLGISMYLSFRLHRVPTGPRTHLIHLFRHTNVFGTEREYYLSEIAKEGLIPAIFVGGAVNLVWERFFRGRTRRPG